MLIASINASEPQVNRQKGHLNFPSLLIAVLLAACAGAPDPGPAAARAAVAAADPIDAAIADAAKSLHPGAVALPPHSDGALRILRFAGTPGALVAVRTLEGIETRRLRADAPIRVRPLRGPAETFHPLGGVMDLSFTRDPVFLEGVCAVTTGDVRCRFRRPEYVVSPGETVRVAVSVELPGDQPAALRIRFDAVPEGYEVHPQEVPWSPLYGPTDLPVRVTAPEEGGDGLLTATIMAEGRTVARVAAVLRPAPP